MTDVAWVQLATVITMALGFLFQWAREARNRRWDLHDRYIARADLESKHLENKKGLERNTVLTIAASKASGEAVEVANTMNEKIIDLNQRLVELGALFDTVLPMPAQVDTVDKKVDKVLAVIDQENAT